MLIRVTASLRFWERPGRVNSCVLGVTVKPVTGGICVNGNKQSAEASLPLATQAMLNVSNILCVFA